MKFSLLHTSARPDKWREIYDSWLQAANHPERVEYVLVADERWGFKELPQLRPQDKLIWNTGRRCYVEGVNLAASTATGDVLIVIADDQYPCSGWDNKLSAVIAESCPFPDFVIAVNTQTPAEKERGIIVMPVVSRARYDSLGYIFYPQYESMYADNDLYEHAVHDECLVEARHLTFPHRHFLFTPGVKKDEAYDQQNRQEAYSLGQRVLQARREAKFRDLDFQVPAQALAESSGAKSIAVCLPGENYSAAWVACWTELLAWMIHKGFRVHPIMTYSSSVYRTRTQLMKEALKLKADYCLWIDDDNLVLPAHVDQLLIDLEHCPEIDIVAGWSWVQADPQQGIGFRISAGRFNPEMDVIWMAPDDLTTGGGEIKQVECSGMPVMLMKTEVLAKLGRHAFLPIQLPPEKEFGQMGEDISFCIHAREAGYGIWVDRRVGVAHLKLGPIGPAAVQRHTQLDFRNKFGGESGMEFQTPIAEVGNTILPAAAAVRSGMEKERAVTV